MTLSETVFAAFVAVFLTVFGILCFKWTANNHEFRMTCANSGGKVDGLICVRYITGDDQ
jgi:hypothetical protein